MPISGWTSRRHFVPVRFGRATSISLCRSEHNANSVNLGVLTDRGVVIFYNWEFDNKPEYSGSRRVLSGDTPIGHGDLLMFKNNHALVLSGDRTLHRVFPNNESRTLLRLLWGNEIDGVCKLTAVGNGALIANSRRIIRSDGETDIASVTAWPERVERIFRISSSQGDLFAVSATGKRGWVVNGDYLDVREFNSKSIMELCLGVARTTVGACFLALYPGGITKGMMIAESGLEPVFELFSEAATRLDGGDNCVIFGGHSFMEFIRLDSMDRCRVSESHDHPSVWLKFDSIRVGDSVFIAVLMADRCLLLLQSQ